MGALAAAAALVMAPLASMSATADSNYTYDFNTPGDLTQSQCEQQDECSTHHGIEQGEEIPAQDVPEAPARLRGDPDTQAGLRTKPNVIVAESIVG